MRLLRLIVAPITAITLASCGAASQAETPRLVSASYQADGSPGVASSAGATLKQRPRVSVINAAYLASELGSVELAIRQPGTPGSEYASLGQRQQRAYHLLAAHSEWIPAVLGWVPSSVRNAIQDNLAAAQQIETLNGPSARLPRWRIIAPPAPDTLMGYYNEAQQAYGVPWPYLAAINLIETNMGRIQGLSSAGAQGPMQFMPATWASYGHGDVNNPHDAILAAGRYLHAHGAPGDMNRAVYAYNPSQLYVHAVMLYAKQMFADSRAYLGYYNWQVYVETTSGQVLLPEGFSG
jgi:soluble lytic murein transglycosylase-like protein